MIGAIAQMQYTRIGRGDLDLCHKRLTRDERDRQGTDGQTVRPISMDSLARTGQAAPMFSIVLDWEAFKDWLSTTVHLTHHDLHLLLGVGFTLAFGWILRRPLGSWLPLLIVVALELLNETSDFTRYHVSGWPWTPLPTLIDMAITILPPLAIVLAARWNSAHFQYFRRRQRIIVQTQVDAECHRR